MGQHSPISIISHKEIALIDVPHVDIVGNTSNLQNVLKIFVFVDLLMSECDKAFAP